MGRFDLLCEKILNTELNNYIYNLVNMITEGRKFGSGSMDDEEVYGKVDLTKIKQILKKYY